MKMHDYINVCVVMAALALGGCATIPLEIDPETSSEQDAPAESRERATQVKPDKPAMNFTIGPWSSAESDKEISTQSVESKIEAASSNYAPKGEQSTPAPEGQTATTAKDTTPDEASGAFTLAFGPWGSTKSEAPEEAVVALEKPAEAESHAAPYATRADHPTAVELTGGAMLNEVGDNQAAPTESREVTIVERTMKRDVEATSDAVSSYLVVVRPGDYLGKIAVREYDDLGQWKNIYGWNRELIGDNPNVIHPYRELTLYKHQDEIPFRPYDFMIHTADKGESLWSIAKDWYGDNLAWVVIYSDNEVALNATDGRLVSGMELKIRTVLINGTPEEVQFSANSNR